MQPGPAVERRGPVELEDELDVGTVALGCMFRSFRPVLGELAGLPQLPLVLAEVLDDEGPHVGDVEQPLAGGVDGEAAQIAGDPAPVQLLSHGGGGSAADEAVEDEVVFVGGGADDAVEEGFGFLGGVTKAL